MSEENKPNNTGELTKHAKAEIAKIQKRESLIATTIERLRNEPAIQEYFKAFHPMSVESFIHGYAQKLQWASEYGAMYIQMNEEQSTEYLERAELCLAEIQIKKLYDLRCQWGANLVHIPGVQTSADMYAAGEDVMHSTMVPPITRQEFDLYYEYACSPLFQYQADGVRWGDIESERTTDEDFELSPWFLYHNTHTEGNLYCQMPDIRGEKENEYRNASYKKSNLEIEAKYETGALKKHVPDDRPHIWDHRYGDVLEFMKKFESPETVRLFQGYCEYGNGDMLMDDEDEDDEENTYLNEQVQTIMDTLSSMKDVRLPIKKHADWRIALIKAWNEYETNQTVAALPTAYEQYLFMIENKISLPSHGSIHRSNAEYVNNQILEGRELLGEPRNFDF